MSEVDLHAALRAHFNFPAFRPGQAEAIQHVLRGQHTLVVMPTGSGKSLIYQLAALHLPGVTLVVSPLIALMKDQVDSLTRRGLAATFINSSLAASEQTDRLRAVAAGRFKIVLVAPERLRSRAFREALSHSPISLLTVDEAHCLSQWGHDFRPDYLHIAEARDQFHAPIVLALTATATPRVQDDIIQLLGLAQAERIITGFNRPNLTLEVFSTPDVKAKLNFLRDFLAQTEGGAPKGGGILYTGTRRDAEEVADFVREVARVEAAAYHGLLDSETRTRVQDAFMAGDLPIVVATNAFGMGIDRPDVRFVLHYAVPGTLEAYYQEAGRAGRDGLPARAILLYSPKDTALHEFFIENDAPALDELRAVYGYLQRVPITRLDGIERALGLPQIKARVAVEQLEIAQALRREPDEVFGVMRVEVLPLNEAQLQAVAAQVQKRREHKYRQLEVMIDYAETNACRRRSILQHFGDTGSADAPLCCDNCLAQTETDEAPRHPSDLTQAERAALIVLDTLKHLKWPIGKTKLAQLLKGSAAKDMQRFEYDRARNYGKFAALKKFEIEALLDQLIESGYVKQVGSERPTLKLTPRGESALQTRSAIRIELRHIAPGETQRVKAAQEAGGTIALTGQLLARGLTPDQIAAERGLTTGTIYSHLAHLIAQGQVDVKAVVAAEVRQRVRAAIETAGSVGYLAPIKALLPDDFDYGLIRCVVEAWKLEQTPLPAESQLAAEVARPDPAGLVDLPCEPLRRWRQQRAAELNQPDWVVFGDGALRQLAQRRPHTKAELRSVSGLSTEVIEKYGDELIAVIGAGASTETIDAIIECVRALPGELPRSGAAKLLVGSTSQRVEKYAAHPLYNRLSGHNRSDVTLQVDILLEIGCLQQEMSGHLVVTDAQVKPAASPKGTPAVPLFECLRAWRLKQSQSERVPAFVVFSDETLREIASIRPRSFQALAAIQGVGPIKMDKYGMDVIALVAEAMQSTSGEGVCPHKHSTENDADPVSDFLSRAHPRPLPGPWLAGWALDFHSRYDGDAASRSVIGELVFRYKYGQEHQLAEELARRWCDLLAAHPELPACEAVVPVPPSQHRASDPMTVLAQTLAKQLKIPVWTNVLLKTRATRPQKELTSLAQKRANVAGAFAVQGDVRGKLVILIDDLYDSGATLEEAAKVLSRGGVSGMVVLTLTRTIHSDA
jgi:ATP-dependent DNA helicase RecQ